MTASPTRGGMAMGNESIGNAGCGSAQTKMESAGKYPSLNFSDKLSVINALMEQDRIEIRERQEAVFRLTYLVVPGFLAIAGFSADHHNVKGLLILALLLILAIYLVSFFTFRKWLDDSRACQQIREEFYQQPDLLCSEDFTPIRPIAEKDRELRFKDNALWLPFGVTVASAVVLLTYIMLA